MTSHPFHKSSFRPHLILGAERKPMLLLILISIALAMTGMNTVSYITAAILWFGLHPLLVWMAKIDPDMVGVYFGHRKYPGYIPPHTSPFRKREGYRIQAQNKSWKAWRR